MLKCFCESVLDPALFVTLQGEGKGADGKPATSSEPWTVNVTSYEFASAADSSVKPQTFHTPQPKQPPPTFLKQPSVTSPKQPPPTSPKPKFKANTLSQKAAVEKSSCPVIPTWGEPPTNPNLHHVWNAEANQLDANANVQTKAPMFKVAKVDAKLQKWQPTAMKNIAFDDPRHKFNAGGMNMLLLNL